MPRLISFPGSWEALAEGSPYRLPDGNEPWGSIPKEGYADLSEFEIFTEARCRWEDEPSGTVRIWQDVTRRSTKILFRPGDTNPRDRYEWVPGFTTAKPGDTLRAVEWWPRRRRWACELCGSLRKAEVLQCFGAPRHAHPDPEHQGVCEGRVKKRLPREGPLIEVVSVGEERLGDVTPIEVAREGFPGRSPEWYVAHHCNPGPLDPERRVTRIVFRSERRCANWTKRRMIHE